MEFFVGGMRGSLPAAGSEFVDFGGQTTSFLVVGSSGELVVIDAGSGLRVVETRLSGGELRVLLLLTHFHLDHLIGLPGFGPLYAEDAEVSVWGPELGAWTPRRVLGRLLADPFWPVPAEKLRGLHSVESLRAEERPDALKWGSLRITWCSLHHPGGSVAYRIEEPESGSALVVATDLEWRLSSEKERLELLELIRTPRTAQLLVFDANYTAQSYPSYRGWGHSTLEDALEVAQQTGVEELVITHLGFEKDDRELSALEERLRRSFPRSAIARTGMSLNLPAA